MQKTLTQTLWTRKVSSMQHGVAPPAFVSAHTSQLHAWRADRKRCPGQPDPMLLSTDSFLSGGALYACLPAGLPLVYNEARIASFWGKRPGELASRWTRFAAVSGEQQQLRCARYSCITSKPAAVRAGWPTPQGVRVWLAAVQLMPPGA
jgi:hypothetical protein